MACPEHGDPDWVHVHPREYPVSGDLDAGFNWAGCLEAWLVLCLLHYSDTLDAVAAFYIYVEDKSNIDMIAG